MKNNCKWLRENIETTLVTSIAFFGLALSYVFFIILPMFYGLFDVVTALALAILPSMATALWLYITYSIFSNRKVKQQK